MTSKDMRRVPPPASSPPPTPPPPVGAARQAMNCPHCGTPHIDVRRIVLDIIDGNDVARHAYLHDPAMKHGVEVTIGTLSRAATVLASHGWPPDHIRGIIREIAVACSNFGGGQEDVMAIAEANSQLFPDPVSRATTGPEAAEQ